MLGEDMSGDTVLLFEIVHLRAGTAIYLRQLIKTKEQRDIS